MEFILSIVASVIATILMAACMTLWRQREQIGAKLAIYSKKYKPDKTIWVPGPETLCEDYTALTDEEKLRVIAELAHSRATCYQDCGFLIDMLENVYLLENKRTIKKAIMRQIEENKRVIDDLPYVQMM